ncbi:GHKL domain-containing protein [Clostridioides difficile]
MIYHIIFIGVNNNIKKYIIKSALGGVICGITYTSFSNTGVWTTGLIILLTVVITSLLYKKNIAVNIVEVLISAILVIVIELILTFIILTIIGSSDLPELILFLVLATPMSLILYMIYKVMQVKQFKFDAFIERYNYILIICIDAVIAFLVIKVLFQIKGIEYISSIEISILFLAMIAVNIFYFFDIYKKHRNNKSSEIKESMNPLIQELIDEMKASEHEYKNHLNILYCMIQVCKENELRDRAKKYIGNVFEDKNLLSSLSNIENTILKAVLLSKITQAKKSEISCNYEIHSQLDGIPLDDSELTVILSNLLNNAIEAAGKSQNKFIEILIEQNDEKYIIKVSNSADNLTKEMIPEIDKVRFSTKGKGRGYGLYNIKNIVSKYKGKVHMSIEDDIFNVLIEI